MTIEAVIYYLGYAAALIVCRGLGRLFYIPMLLNLCFDLAIQFDMLADWDIRWVMVGYGFLFFAWVAALIGNFDRITVIALLAIAVSAIYFGVVPQLRSVGSGQEFWDLTSTSIVHVWMLAILVACLSAIIKSSLVSKIKQGYSELLIIPKRRFLIPIAMWSAMWLIPDILPSSFPKFIGQHRAQIAALLLVWGWFAFELPFYLMYKRMDKQDAS